MTPSPFQKVCWGNTELTYIKAFVVVLSILDYLNLFTIWSIYHYVPFNFHFLADILHNFTALANGTKMCSKHNEASHTIVPAAAGQDVAPNSVEASRMGLSKHTKDLQHHSMQMKGQL